VASGCIPEATLLLEAASWLVDGSLHLGRSPRAARLMRARVRRSAAVVTG
jgi:hypothetical protein